MRLITIQAADPDDARRRKLLNILLAGFCFVLIVLSLIYTVLISIPGFNIGTETDITNFYTASLVSLLILPLIFLINRLIAGWLASWLFLLGLTFTILLTDSPDQVAAGRSLVMFTLPIVASSFLLKPYSSYILAALCGITITCLSLLLGITPNVPVIAVFFTAAFISWISARGLENAVKELRVSHKMAEYESAARKKTEDTLRKNRQQFDILAENITDIIVILTKDSVVNYISGSCANITGYQPEELQYNNLKKYIHPEDKQKLDDFINNLSKIRNFCFRFLIKDGDYIWLEATVREYKLRERDYSEAVCVLQDVTERISLEQRFRQAQKLEAVGRLAGGLAHDFNNILTVILGYCQMLMLEETATIGSKKSELNEIISVSNRAASLTSQLLAFSRNQVLEIEYFNLNMLIQNLKKMLKRLIGEDIRLETKLNPDLLDIKADYNQMEQVIMNLAVNSRDALPNGGSLTIETENLEVKAEVLEKQNNLPPGKYVILSMTDDGIGMDEVTRDRIFEPFFTTKEQGKGTGLGLSTVYGIVKQSSGFIWVYSEPGKGASFKIALPALEPEQKQRIKEKIITKPKGGRETILLAEDESALRNILAKTLSEYGYTVLTASDGKTALDLFHQTDKKIDLLITDIIMPRLSGRELANLLLAKEPQVKLFFISGYAGNILPAIERVDKKVEILAKPFSLNTLLNKIRDLFD